MEKLTRQAGLYLTMLFSRKKCRLYEEAIKAIFFYCASVSWRALEVTTNHVKLEFVLRSVGLFIIVAIISMTIFTIKRKQGKAGKPVIWLC